MRDELSKAYFRIKSNYEKLNIFAYAIRRGKSKWFFFVLKSLGNVFLFKHITVSTAAPFHDLSKPKLLNTFR